MLAAVTAPPGKTAWDLMLSTPLPVTNASPLATRGELTPRAFNPGGQDSAESGGQVDPWAFHHLGHAYFAQIVDGCRQHGSWPLRILWTGVTGLPYAEKANGKRIDPNWMVEDAKGRRYTRSGGFTRPHAYNAGRMRAWPFDEIAAYYDLQDN